MVPDITSSLWGSIPIFSVLPWRSVLISSSFGALVPIFLILTFLLLRGRASLLRNKGLLTVDVSFYYGEHLGHACQRVLQDREH